MINDSRERAQPTEGDATPGGPVGHVKKQIGTTDQSSNGPASWLALGQAMRSKAVSSCSSRVSASVPASGFSLEFLPLTSLSDGL